MENLSGTLVKGYELQERIGSGGFGAVYKAKQTTVGREVAIKIILPGLANRPDFIRRFETEAQLIARLEHPFIVPLFDYWRDPNGAYLVMRWLRGGSLRDALQQGAFAIDAAATLMDQITGALSAAHRHGVIHRDLKPGNILLDEDSNAYLADFGIAKDVGVTGSGEVTEPDQIIGSPDYLAPEQARCEPVTPHTDIYSLGVVLYELLTGQHPFPNITGVERLFKHLNEPLPVITSLDPTCRDALNDVIQTATQKDPARRFTDVLAMAAAFRKAIATRNELAETEVIELLTLREQEILQGIIDGLANNQIADRLFIELSTVKWYIKQIYKKLGVRSRVQAIVRARELDLIVPGPDNGHPTVIGGTTSTTRLPAPENPYKGLRAFQPADEQDFFGREKLTKKIIQRLSEKNEWSRFLAIVGPSGSGKSSLVNAGLIPALWRGELPGSERWFVVEMLPGTHPLDELEVALTRVAADQSGNLNEQLRRDERGLLRASQLILPNDGSELVLIVDQFEEAFTLTENETERQQFLDLLHTAVTEKRSRVRVVVTLRADFYDRPLMYPQFGELVRSRMETVLPLSAKELESVIVNPTKRVGVTFEEGLVATIVSEVNYQPGALPLLQYALTELFEQRNNRVLTCEAYRNIGGTVGALAQRAEELYNELNADGQETTRQMLLRLVTLGEGVEDTRRRTPRAELAAITPNADLLNDIIDGFAEYRLLSLDHDPATRTPTVEIAHEALLREWERLRNWLNENRSDVRMQRQLAQMAGEWRDAKQDRSFLLRGSRLEMFEGWIAGTGLAITAQEREFLDTSLAERTQQEAAQRAQEAREIGLRQRAQRILQALVVVLLAAAVIAGGLALWANNQRSRAEDEKDRAETAEYQAQWQAAVLLATQAESELENGFYDRAVLLALEALENYPYMSQAEHALGQAVSYNRALQQYTGHTMAVTSVAWSPDGTHIASSSTDNSVHVWDAITGEERLVIRLPEGITGNVWDWALCVKWTPDGKYLLTLSGDRFLLGSQDYDLMLWDAATGEQIMAIELPNEAEPEEGAGTTTAWAHYATGAAADFAPEGGRLATIGGNDTAIIWDAEFQQQLVLTGHENDVNAVAWSPDATQLATASEDGTVRIWDAQTGQELIVLSGHEGAVNAVVWSADGTQLASAGDDGFVRFWDTEPDLRTYGEQLNTIEPEAGVIWSLAWSPNNSYLVTSTDDARLRLWKIASGEVVAELNGHSLFVAHVAWSPVDNRLVSAGTDASIRIWNAAPSTAALSLPESYYGGSGFEWFPDSRYLAIADGDFFQNMAPGKLMIWDNATGQLVTEHLTPEFTYPVEVVLSPDERLLLTRWLGLLPEGFAELGTAYLIDLSTGEMVGSFTVAEDEWIRDLAWSPDGTQIAGATANGKVYLWDAQTGDLLNTLVGHDQAVMIVQVAWSPDGTRIVTASDDKTARIWNADTGETLLVLTHEIGVWSATWSPDGSRILTTSGNDEWGGGENAFRIWDATTGEELLFNDWHAGQVTLGSWSPDGSRVATGSSDGTTRIWDAANGNQLLTLSTPNNWGASPTWSPDGQFLAVVTMTSGLPTRAEVRQVWQSTDDLITYAHECCVFRELMAEERQQFGLSEQ